MGSSNRKYAMLGSLRGVAQTISYEIRLALIFLTILLYSNSYEIEEIMKSSKLISILLILPFTALLWVISCLAETNRTPFDFSEGESELVSGFNVEYGSGGFAVIFIAEYARIYFLRMLRTFVIFGCTFIEIKRRIFIVLLIFFWV